MIFKTAFLSSGTEYHVPENPGYGELAEGTIFKVGDRVRVNCDVETLKRLQKDHGGWNPKMSQVRVAGFRVGRLSSQRSCVSEMVMNVTLLHECSYLSL